MNRGPTSHFWGKPRSCGEGLFHSSSKASLEAVLKSAAITIRKKLKQLDEKEKGLFIPGHSRFGKLYYPESVFKEHTQYFVDEKEAQTKRESPEITTSYVFDRKPARRLKKTQAEKPKWLSVSSTKDEMENTKISARSLLVSKSCRRLASYSAGNWVKSSDHAMSNKRRQLQHLLSIIQVEQLKEIERAKSLLRADDDENQTKHTLRKVEELRADRADWIMRILQDYHLISGAEMSLHLQRIVDEGGSRAADELVTQKVEESKSERPLTSAADWEWFKDNETSVEEEAANTVLRRNIIVDDSMRDRALRSVERRRTESRELLRNVFSRQGSPFDGRRPMLSRQGSPFDDMRSLVSRSSSRGSDRLTSPPRSAFSRRHFSRGSSRVATAPPFRSLLTETPGMLPPSSLPPRPNREKKNAAPSPGGEHRQWFGWGRQTSWSAEKILEKESIKVLANVMPPRQRANPRFGKVSERMDTRKHQNSYSFLLGRAMPRQ